ESADVEIVNAVKSCPSQFPSLITPSRATAMGCHVMGIEVRPVYRDMSSGQLFPMVHKALRRRLAKAYKRGFFDFTKRHTTHRPAHYNALGPRAMVKAVWAVDEKLASVSSSFDLLLSVTPTNAEAAWKRFRKSRFEQTPEFVYRPLPMDPSLLKRELYRAPIERIEDPTLAHLFSKQQLDLDHKISLLAERGTPLFIYSSLQLYGSIDDELLSTAREILDLPHSREREERQTGSVDAQSFAARANEEIDYLKLTYPDIKSRVRVRKDIIGLMVSRGNLLIGSNVKIPPYRVPAAIAHEVGTHIVTYINGLAQPFRQLSAGLPGYEELQEGLAVFAEYLVGGLNLQRLRLLAARVVAVKMMIDGASFIEVFRELDSTCGFTKRTAYLIALRVFRGGGLTKDAVYLRGLIQLIAHLQNGGTLDPLYSGKFALRHVPIIQELQMRRVLGPSPLRPTYLDMPEALERVEKVRSGLRLTELVSER
ncbi:MAG: flavohemoglobin expression-modulating QEGLA motif protein, partial [Gammaproteobacteria bacterium]|nr:flavohemoglobin expression-modulating QEGLA motif protein [Gammaproteobacteria bacterium]